MHKSEWMRATHKTTFRRRKVHKSQSNYKFVPFGELLTVVSSPRSVYFVCLCVYLMRFSLSWMLVGATRDDEMFVVDVIDDKKRSHTRRFDGTFVEWFETKVSAQKTSTKQTMDAEPTQWITNRLWRSERALPQIITVSNETHKCESL